MIIGVFAVHVNKYIYIDLPTVNGTFGTLRNTVHSQNWNDKRWKFTLGYPSLFALVNLQFKVVGEKMLLMSTLKKINMMFDSHRIGKVKLAPLFLLPSMFLKIDIICTDGPCSPGGQLQWQGLNRTLHVNVTVLRGNSRPEEESMHPERPNRMRCQLESFQRCPKPS